MVVYKKSYYLFLSVNVDNFFVEVLKIKDFLDLLTYQQNAKFYFNYNEYLAKI